MTTHYSDEIDGDSLDADSNFRAWVKAWMKAFQQKGWTVVPFQSGGIDMFGEEQTEPWWDRRDTVMLERIKDYANACNAWPEDERVLEIFEYHSRLYLQAGDIAYETLPAFKVMDLCLKCGNNNPKKFHVEYVSPTTAKLHCPRHAGEREHLHIGCDKCGYHFSMKVYAPEDGPVTGWHGHSAPSEGIPS